MANTATAVLNPVNNSGVSAQLVFTESDDGSLRVDDRTLGVEPAPIPSGNPGDLVFSPSATARMLLPSLWSGPLGLPVGTSRSLNVTKPTVAPLGVRLNEIKTVSIREAVRSLLFARGTSGRQLLSLSACGQIRRTP